MIYVSEAFYLGFYNDGLVCVIFWFWFDLKSGSVLWTLQVCFSVGTLFGFIVMGLFLFNMLFLSLGGCCGRFWLVPSASGRFDSVWIGFVGLVSTRLFWFGLSLGCLVRSDFFDCRFVWFDLAMV